MNKLESRAKSIVRSRGGKIPQLGRIKWGRRIMAFSALPLFNAWMFPIGAVMSITIKPSVWAKSKLIAFDEWRRLR